MAERAEQQFSSNGNGNVAGLSRAERAEQQFSGTGLLQATERLDVYLSPAEWAERQFSNALPDLSRAERAERQFSLTSGNGANGIAPLPRRDPATEARNKALFRRWFAEAWNKGHLEVADEIVDPGFVVHGAGGQVVQSGPHGVKELIREWRTGFPDGEMTIDGLTAEGDLVVAHLTWHGTHTGPFSGVAPTGKSVTVTSIGIARMKDGKVVEGWGEMNMLGLLQQVGALPLVPVPVPERRKALFRLFAEEAWNKGNMAVVYQLFAPAYVAHAGQDVSYDVHGPEGHAAYITEFRKSFPDVHLTYDDMLAEDDILVVRMRWTGTHTGEPYMGVPATGRRVSLAVTGVNRWVGDQVVEAWGVVDMMGLLQQLGLIPAPPPQTANKALVRRYVEDIWNAYNLDLIPDLFAPDYQIHTVDMTMTASHDMLRQGITASHGTFPDFHMAIQHLVADGDKVSAHWVVTGTHKGPFQLPGMPQAVPPSGKPVTFTEMATFRIADGKIVEGWYMADTLSMLQQLGAIPGPPPPRPVATTPPDPEANKAILRRLVEEVWNQRHLDVIDDLFDSASTTPYAPWLAPGPTGVHTIATMVFTAFPDFKMRIDRVIAEGDMVTARFVQEGTHLGDFLGFAPSGKHLTWTEIGSLRVVNNKIVECIFETDMLTILQQTGALRSGPEARLDSLYGGTALMSVEDENKGVFHRWFGEAWNKGNYDVAYQVIDQHMRVHGAGGQPVSMGPDGLIGLIQTWRTAFPDGHMDVDGLIAEGDLVAALLTWHGTQQAEFYGVPASNVQVACTSIGIDRVQNGIITDGWGELDMAGMMQQMGALPMVGPGYTSQGKSAEWGGGAPAPKPGSTSKDENKALAQRLIEALNAGTESALTALIGPANYVEHNPVWGTTNFQDSVKFQTTLRAAMPDLRYTLDQGIIIAEGDQVAVHTVVSGTHTGADLFGVPASGKTITWTQSDWVRIAAGKIVERWVSADNLAAMQQSGALPSPGG